MKEIEALNYKFFLGAAKVGGKSNETTGSISLNAQSHNALNDEFKYKLSLRKIEEKNFLVVAQCYVGKFSFENTDPEKIQTLEFEGSDNGVDEAKKWLSEAYEKIMKDR